MNSKKKGSKEIVSKNFFPVAIIISLISIAILLVISIVFLYVYSNSETQKITFSKEIKSVSFDENLSSIYLKLNSEQVNESQILMKVKIILSNLNGTNYTINTGKNYSELLISSVEIPAKKGFFDFFVDSTSYNYQLTISQVPGLNNFNEISGIKIDFSGLSNLTARAIKTSQAPATSSNKTAKKTTASSTSSSSSSTPSTPNTNTNNCTNGAWQNVMFRCNSGAREVKQSRLLCSGNIEEAWILSACPEGYACYDGYGAPSNLCINSTLSCSDSDNGINSTTKGMVNISEIFNDNCIDNKNLTEYFCKYNGTNFVPGNQTINCQWQCSSGACAFCNDSDKDGLSPDSGFCGPVDCNDSDINILTCPDINAGLVAHYPLNESLNDIINSNNAGCTSCPNINSSAGLNNSNAYQFDGISNSLTLPSLVLNNNTYSISVLIKPIINSNDPMILYSNSGLKNLLNLYLDSSENLITISNEYGLFLQSPANSVAPGEFSNLILTYDYADRQAKLYINGKLNASATILKQTPDPTEIIIGAKTNQQYFNGIISDLRIYNRTLTNNEITLISNQYADQELASLNFWQSLVNWIKSWF